jgi:hypothetical protein
LTLLAGIGYREAAASLFIAKTVNLLALIRRGRQVLWIAWGLWLGWLEAPGALAAATEPAEAARRGAQGS